VKEGNSPNLPSFYAQAYVPIFVDRRPIAIVAAYVDQTDQRDNFYRTFLIEAVLLCLMTGLSFLIPMIACAGVALCQRRACDLCFRAMVPVWLVAGRGGDTAANDGARRGEVAAG
jgi:hypothetical protein